MIELRGIRKTYPDNSVQACAGVDFTIRRGEVHVLVGDNGAGKSTLVQILAGLLRPDSGEILLEERPLSKPRDVKTLRRAVALVPQNPTSSDDSSALEQVFLMIPRDRLRITEPLTGKTLPLVRRHRARSFLLPLFRGLSEETGLSLDPDARTERLDPGGRTILSLFGALVRRPSVLILDEPTAHLSNRDSALLLDFLVRFREGGHSVVLITHRLKEAERVCDRVTLMERGRIVDSGERADLGRIAAHFGSIAAQDGIIPAQTGMIAAQSGTGEESVEASPPQEHRTRSAPSAPKDGEALLSLQGFGCVLRGFPPFENVSLELRAGEVVALLGLKESGLEALELSLSELLLHPGKRSGPRPSGTVHLKAGSVAAYVPSDRLGKAVCLRASIEENLVIHQRRKLAAGIFLPPVDVRNYARRVLSRFRVEGNPSLPLSTLSGGNVQKALLSREFDRNPDLMILSRPFQGLDAAAKRALAAEIRRSVGAGMGLLILSSDIEETTALADGIVVLSGGRVSASFAGGKVSNEELGRALAGWEKAE